MSIRRKVLILIGICLIPIWLSACNKSNPVITTTPSALVMTSTFTASPVSTETPIPPTATPVPLAALVNGEAITLSEFEAELARFQAANTITGTILASDANTIVLDELVGQTLLAQAAVQNGYVVDDSVVQSRINTLEEQLGSAQALQDWQLAHGYSSQDFYLALKRSIAAAWMRDQIVSTVPATAEQVHAFQILVPTSAEAEQFYSRLQSGEAFMDVAKEYDPMTMGDLGWFPRGYLIDPVIEEAAFALQPEQYSQVIKTDTGFHILYVQERDPAHVLQPDARRVLQLKAVQDWIANQKKQSEIQVLLP